MGIFDKLKTKKDDAPEVVEPKQVKPKTAEPKAKPVRVASDAKPGVMKGKTIDAYRILVRPLVTEKASQIGVQNKYIFAVSKDANKIEVKKAIRSVYNVNPLNVRIINVRGRSVRYGRSEGTTKAWKKAIITLKEGDKIEVYEGV
jgi:large subunit ribosomal protein L23